MHKPRGNPGDLRAWMRRRRRRELLDAKALRALPPSNWKWGHGGLGALVWEAPGWRCAQCGKPPIGRRRKDALAGDPARPGRWDNPAAPDDYLSKRRNRRHAQPAAWRRGAGLPHAACEPGITTAKSTAWPPGRTSATRARRSTIGYQPAGLPPHPASLCTSVNHVVCHGIPNDKPLKKGDIVNVDVTVITDLTAGLATTAACS